MSGRSLVAFGFVFLIAATVAAPIESEDAVGSSSTPQGVPDNSNPTTGAAQIDDSTTVPVPEPTSNPPENSGGPSNTPGGSTSQQETRPPVGSTDGGASPPSEVPQPSGETVEPTESPNPSNPPNPSGQTFGPDGTTVDHLVTEPNHSEPPVTRPPPHTEKPGPTTPPPSDDGTTAGGSDTENPHSGATGPVVSVTTALSNVTGSSTQGTVPTTTGTQGLHATLSLLTVFVARFLF